MTNFQHLPENLPMPENDGACDHLLNHKLPDIELESTSGESIKFSKLKGLSVIFCYPMTGKPDEALPKNWDSIPGARGCTPQNCAFASKYAELRKFVNRIYGLSAQTPEFQKEAKTRLSLNHELLADKDFKFADSLKLPTFETESKKFMKRVTLIIKDNRIIKFFYPVFPPDKDAENTLNWLKSMNF